MGVHLDTLTGIPAGPCLCEGPRERTERGQRIACVALIQFEKGEKRAYTHTDTYTNTHMCTHTYTNKHTSAHLKSTAKMEMMVQRIKQWY